MNDLTFYGLNFSLTSLSPSVLALVVLAGACTVYAYVRYFSHVKDETPKPNSWSWTIWGVTTFVEALTYQLVSDDLVQTAVFYVSAFACVWVSWGVWKYGKPRKPDLTDWLCIAATIAALFVWVVFHEEWWAHVIMVLAVPVSFIPIWIETWHQPEKERAAPWVWWSIGDLLTLMLILNLIQGNLAENQRELPYVVVEFACHFGMLLIVIGRKSVGRRRVRTRFGGSLSWNQR